MKLKKEIEVMVKMKLKAWKNIWLKGKIEQTQS